MEEGPEPQEWVEKSVEHHHEHEHEHHSELDSSELARRQTMISAVTAAVLAVCAAVGSLLSGHAANGAILSQTRATDQWAYFQASSTKGHLYKVGQEIVRVLAEAQGGTALDKTQLAVDRFAEEVKRYDKKKEREQEEAEHLEREGQRDLGKHERFALGVAAFQVGIVLASISIMVRYGRVWWVSLVAGGVGVVLVGLGLAH
jgi:hypothetical protein